MDASAAASVHLASWPSYDEAAATTSWSRQVALVRRLVELGRSARADAKVRTRQPLRRALVASSAYARLSDELLAEVADELNVGAVEPLSSAEGLVDFSVKVDFRALGKRFAKRTPVVAAAIAAADASALAATLHADGRATVPVDGEDVEVLADEVIVTERPREGWTVVNEQGETVALDLELTPELERAGLAREVVRLVQEARKASGFEVSDRIALRWSADGDTATALREHEELIRGEVLATEVEETADLDGSAVRDADLRLAFTVSRV